MAAPDFTGQLLQYNHTNTWEIKSNELRRSCMLGFCEHGNECMDSVKCREFLAKLRNQASLGLCSMGLVI